MSPSTREILEKVQRGELSAEEGAALLNQAQAGTFAPEPPPPPAPEMPPPGAKQDEKVRIDDKPDFDPELDGRLQTWKRWWLFPLWIGMGIFIIGAALIALGSTAPSTFWFVCGFFPLLFGVFFMLLAWWSQRARWVHVRVRESHGDGSINRVAISMPVPISLGGWFFRTFGGVIPGLREQGKVVEMLPELFHELEHNREPIAVEVNEGDGTEVRVYIL